MDDWLFRLKDEYDAQQQEYTHALDDLKAQEEQDQYQALADLMSGAGPEIDFSKLGTHGTAADALDAYGTEIARRALQAKVDIMANYADAAGSLRDEQERSRQDYLQQKNQITKLLSGSGLTELANRKIKTDTGEQKFVPEDPSLRSEIEQRDVINPDGSVTPSFHYLPKKVNESDVRATELASFLGIPEDVVRTQMLQEKIGQPDVTPEALQERHRAEVGESVKWSKEIVQNPELAKVFEGADPESVGGRALDLAKSLRSALDATNTAKSDKQFVTQVQSRALAAFDKARADNGGKPLSPQEMAAITKGSFTDIITARWNALADLETYKNRKPNTRMDIADVGLGRGSQEALAEAINQLGGNLQPRVGGALVRGPAREVPSPLEELLAPTGVPYPQEKPFAEQFRALDELLNLVSKDPRVQNELLRMFGLR